MNIQELQHHIASRIKKQRIFSKLTQKDLAIKADIPLSTYRRFEQKGEGSIKDFIKILVSLNRVNELDIFLSSDEYSPIKEYEQMQKTKNNKDPKRVKHGS
jgi:transcriptional regulator with XRE-family HTH domain